MTAQYVTEVDGKPSIADLMRPDPILYTLDNRYYGMGGAIGVAYKEAGPLVERHGLKR